LAWPFIEPVNAIALNLPDYYQIVKNPMDLGTVQDHLLKGRYTTIDSFSNDVKLVWANCFLYNHKDSDVVKMAENLSHFFDEKFKKISENTYEEISYESEQIDIQPVDNKEQTLITPSIQTFEIKKRPQQKRAPKTPQVDSRVMEFEEKKRLSEAISLLQGEKLAQIVQIIQSRAPKASSQANDQEIEIDIEKLDPVTLRQIEKQVKLKKGKQTQKREPKKENNTRKNSNDNTTNSTTSTTTSSTTSTKNRRKRKRIKLL